MRSRAEVHCRGRERLVCPQVAADTIYHPPGARVGHQPSRWREVPNLPEETPILDAPPSARQVRRFPLAAKLIDRLGVTWDPDVEEQIYREVLDIFRADAPATFLLPRVFTVVVRRRLRGLSSPWRGSPMMFMEDLWLED